MKEALIEYFSYFTYYDFILCSAFLMLAMCFIFLSFLTFRRKIVSIPSFLIGFAIIIALPFGLRYFMEERFYKVEKDVTQDRVLRYSPIYQYNATITNKGKRKITGCIISHQILYDTDKESGINKYKYMLLNYAKPKKIYNKDIPMDLAVGESARISMQSQEFPDDYPHKGEKYVTKVECYGKPRHDDGANVLKGQFIPKAEKEENKEEVQNLTQELDDDIIDIDDDIDDEFDDNTSAQNATNAVQVSNNQDSSSQDSNIKESSELPKEEIIENINPNQDSNNIAPAPDSKEEQAKEWEIPKLLKEMPR